MNKYQDGKIYRIVGGDKVYIGSTTQTLNARFRGHRNHYKSFQDCREYKVMVYEIFEEVGVEECSIELVEDFPCSSKRELEERERYWIETMECVNKCLPVRTQEDLLKYQKEYRDNHKDERAEKNKEWREANREELLQKKKEYYERTKDIDIEARRERQREAQKKYRERQKALKSPQ